MEHIKCICSFNYTSCAVRAFCRGITPLCSVYSTCPLVLLIRVTLKFTKRVEHDCRHCTTAPRYPKEHFSEESATYPARPWVSASIKMKMSKPVYRIGVILLTGEYGSTGRKKLCHCHFINHEYRIDWPEIKPCPERNVLGLHCLGA